MLKGGHTSSPLGDLLYRRSRRIPLTFGSPFFPADDCPPQLKWGSVVVQRLGSESFQRLRGKAPAARLAFAGSSQRRDGEARVEKIKSSASLPPSFSAPAAMSEEVAELNFSSPCSAFLANECTESEEQHFQHHGQFSAPVSVLLAALMGLLVLSTVLGNALVILAFVVDKSLRTQGNFFFLNLAIADLLVGE